MTYEDPIQKFFQITDSALVVPHMLQELQKPGKSAWKDPEWVSNKHGWKHKDHEYKKDEKTGKRKTTAVQLLSGIGLKFNEPAVVRTTKEGPNDDRYFEAGRVEGHALFGSSELDIDKKDLSGNLVDIKLEAAALSLVEKVLDNAPPPLPPANFVFLAPGPFAARLGDPTLHGTPLSPGIASPDVFIGGTAAWRVGADLHACPHSVPVPHGCGTTQSNGATDVFINGLPAARAGDIVIETSGPNAIAGGCGTVWFGGPPAPVTCVVPPPPPPDYRIFRVELTKQSDVGYGRVEAKAGFKRSLAKTDVDKDGELGGVAKAEVVGSLYRRRYKGSVGVRVPFTDWVPTIAFDVAIHFFTGGAEVNFLSWPPKPSKYGLIGFDAKAEYAAP